VSRARSLFLGALAAFGVPSATGASTSFSDNHCEERLVLCLDPTAGVIEGGTKPTLRAGERIHVIVIGAPNDRVKVSIEVHSVSSANSTLPREGFRPVDVRTPPPSIKIAEKIVDVPDADELIIYIVQKGDNNKADIHSLPLKIEDTLYFARPGLTFAWIDRGSRTITAESSIVEKTDFFPGVALTIWPWGHRGRTLSALEKRSWGRSIGDAVALQVGTDLDFTKPFDRAFFGLAIEPVSGLGISAGVAVTTGQFFSGAPSGSEMAVVDHKMARLYVSIALTSKLFDTIKALAGKKEEQT
jgi:hypothetical protein